MSGSIVSSQTNKKIEFKEFGLSFETPKGWTGRIEGDYYLLGHSSIPGIMILSKNQSKDTKQLKYLALQGISNEGIQLAPRGDFKVVGNNRVEGFYEGIFSGSQVRVFAIGLINQLGSGINIFMVTEKGKFGEIHIGEAEKLARSVKFFRQKEMPNTDFWKQRIIGKQLKYMITRTNSDSGSGSSGQSDTRIIKLYRDGTFSYYFSASTGYWGQSGSDIRRNRNKGEGTYKIYSFQGRSYLELTSSGKTVEIELTKSKENYTLLDGYRYAVLDINRP